ncbi:hypothetical protein AVEN_115449-1, partial [Araneus ventricosus]
CLELILLRFDKQITNIRITPTEQHSWSFTNLPFHTIWRPLFRGQHLSRCPSLQTSSPQQKSTDRGITPTEQHSWAFTSFPFYTIWSPLVQNPWTVPKSDENRRGVVEMFGFSSGSDFHSAH